MKDFEIRSMADCYNGSLVREFDFAEPVGEHLIMHLGRDKKFDYFPDLPKPYFRIEAEGKYIIRGVRGNTTMRVVLKQPHPEMNLYSLKSALIDYFSRGTGARPAVTPRLAAGTVHPAAGSAARETGGSGSVPVRPDGPRRTVVVTARSAAQLKKAVGKQVPDGLERKHFSARWRLTYLTHRGSGS